MPQKTLTCLGVALLVTPLLAEETSTLFQSLDQDRNGLIEAAEINETQRQAFERLLRVSDRNEDGKLTPAELESGLNPKPQTSRSRPLEDASRLADPAQSPEQIFRFLDRNRDGKISRQELPERMQSRLEPIFNQRGTDELSRQEFLEITRRFRSPASPAPPQMNVPSKPPFLQALDQNNDFRISADELNDAPEVLRKLDQNGDGKLQPAELFRPVQ